MLLFLAPHFEITDTPELTECTSAEKPIYGGQVFSLLETIQIINELKSNYGKTSIR